MPNVIRALIAAQRADIDLDWQTAQAIDLAGRDILEAVRTSGYPKVMIVRTPAARLPLSMPWQETGCSLKLVHE